MIILFKSCTQVQDFLYGLWYTYQCGGKWREVGDSGFPFYIQQRFKRWGIAENTHKTGHFMSISRRVTLVCLWGSFITVLMIRAE
jgi:hypothetical protein